MQGRGFSGESLEEQQEPGRGPGCASSFKVPLTFL